MWRHPPRPPHAGSQPYQSYARFPHTPTPQHHGYANAGTPAYPGAPPLVQPYGLPYSAPPFQQVNHYGVEQEQPQMQHYGERQGLEPTPIQHQDQAPTPYAAPPTPYAANTLYQQAGPVAHQGLPLRSASPQDHEQSQLLSRSAPTLYAAPPSSNGANALYQQAGLASHQD